MRQTTFRSSYPLRLHVKFGFDWTIISEELMFEAFSLYESMKNMRSLGWGHFLPRAII